MLLYNRGDHMYIISNEIHDRHIQIHFSYMLSVNKDYNIKLKVYFKQPTIDC